MFPSDQILINALLWFAKTLKELSEYRIKTGIKEIETIIIIQKRADKISK